MLRKILRFEGRYVSVMEGRGPVLAENGLGSGILFDKGYRLDAGPLKPESRSADPCEQVSGCQAQICLDALEA